MKKFFYFIVCLLFVSVAAFFILFESNEKVRHITYKTLIGQNQIPKDYISVYKEAAAEFNIPWELLASVHRVETIFSTMDPMISPVGALGHFQFMPRTWVGWSYPGGELGQIDDDIDITDITLIEKHRGYGMDASGNGKADPFDFYDATFAAAKYLSDHGASKGEIEKALFAYNQSEEYVAEVLQYYETYVENYETIELLFGHKK